MTPGARLLAALVVAALVLGGLFWWLEWPLAPAPRPPAVAREDADAGGRAQQIRELQRRLEARRAAIAEARERRDSAGDELERLREELAGTRAEIERLEARTEDRGDDAGD